MKITLLMIGKTEENYLLQGIDIYLKRLRHYVNFSVKEIPAIKNTKNLSEETQKEKEGEKLLAQLAPTDQLILLDEKGKSLTSKDFASFLEEKMIRSTRHLVFLIGGPYGFSKQVYERADGKLSLSKMTFSHQMVRLIFLEQLYRAYSIIKSEPYHHE